MPRLPEPQAGEIGFEVLAEIAAGATAKVDLCRATAPAERAGQLLAVKRLHDHIAEDAQFADMFFDEVWMTAALHSENVVEVVGWGNDDDGMYLAVELVQGVSLARLMKTVFDTREIFSERMVVYLGSRLTRGLSAAHALQSSSGELLNLVHRDLTPGNILCGFNGAVKIADFGLAKAKSRVTRTLTGLLKGSPQYMSPEQTQGLEIDARADLFSLGVVLFELFSGRRPWSGRTELQAMQVRDNEPPLDLAEARPRIDKELVNIVMKCLERDPTRRFQSASEITARFDEWLLAHGYSDGNKDALGRFVRRNAMRQMRWFERAIKGDMSQMPESMRPSAHMGRRHRLKRHSMSSSPDSRPAAPSVAPGFVDSDRPRAKSRKAVDNETTAVTDAAGKVAVMHAEDVGRRQSSHPPKAIDDDDSEADWTEEGPTLVHRPELHGQRRLIARHLIADEDSEKQTTVKQGSPRDIVDSDSEEVPTIPIHGNAGALRLRRPGQIVPPSPGVPPAPMHRPAGGGARTVSATNGSSSGTISEQTLLAEADRLAVEAVRLNDASKQSADAAVRAATLAKIANDAAMAAAEAVRIATTVGIAEAAPALERAHALETSLRSEMSKDDSASRHSVAPIGTGERPSSPPMESLSGRSSVVPAMSASARRNAPSASPGQAPPAESAESPPAQGTIASLLDSASFQLGLRPTVYGMPTQVALALALGGVIALLLVIILIIA